MFCVVSSILLQSLGHLLLFLQVMHHNLSSKITRSLFNPSTIHRCRISILANDLNDSTCERGNDLITQATSIASLALGFEVLGVGGGRRVDAKAYNTSDLIILMSRGDEVSKECVSVRLGLAVALLALEHVY